MIKFLNQVSFAFKVSASVLLVLTALAKLLPIVLTKMPYFYAPDPIFSFLRLHTTLAFAAILEFVIAAVILKSKSQDLPFLLMIWFCSVLFLYRLGLFLTNYKEPCHCMGGVGVWLGIPDSILSDFSFLSLCYLFIGSLLSLNLQKFERSYAARRILQSLIVFLLGSLITKVQAETVTNPGLGLVCSGFVSEVGFRGDPTNNEVIVSNYFEFKTTLSLDGRYIITVRRMNGTVQWLSFDGRDSFCGQYWASMTTNVPPIAGQTIPIFFISHGCFPYDNRERAVGTLWTVFCSGIFFRTNLSSASYPLPFDMARLDASTYGFRFDAKLSGQAPFLPLHIDYFRDTNSDISLEDPLRQGELDAITDPNQLDRYKKQINWLKKTYSLNGYRAIDVNSDEFTNFNGISIPQTFEVKHYNPRWESGLPVIILSGRVTNLQSIAITGGFQPPIKGPLEVVDNRFRWRSSYSTVDGIVYTIKPGDLWRNSTDPNLVGIFRRMQSSPDKIMRFSVRKYVIAAAILIMFLSLPTYLLWRRFYYKH